MLCQCSCSAISIVLSEHFQYACRFKVISHMEFPAQMIGSQSCPWAKITVLCRYYWPPWCVLLSLWFMGQFFENDAGTHATNWKKVQQKAIILKGSVLAKLFWFAVFIGVAWQHCFKKLPSVSSVWKMEHCGYLLYTHFLITTVPSLNVQLPFCNPSQNWAKLGCLHLLVFVAYGTL